MHDYSAKSYISQLIMLTILLLSAVVFAWIQLLNLEVVWVDLFFSFVFLLLVLFLNIYFNLFNCLLSFETETNINQLLKGYGE